MPRRSLERDLRLPGLVAAARCVRGRAVSFDLRRNAFGRLVFSGEGGVEHDGVVPVRAFPIGAPQEGVSLLSADGRELAWIERLADLPPAQRALVDEALAEREFAPEIRRLHAVSSFSTPSTWTVDTDRGTTRFVLRGEEDIRRVGRAMLVIADSQGLQFVVSDLSALDRASRLLLERFL
jgi:hypothetical protein